MARYFRRRTGYPKYFGFSRKRLAYQKYKKGYRKYKKGCRTSSNISWTRHPKTYSRSIKYVTVAGWCDVVHYDEATPSNGTYGCFNWGNYWKGTSISEPAKGLIEQADKLFFDKVTVWLKNIHAQEYIYRVDGDGPPFPLIVLSL